jgi:hypothetical protein
MNSRKTRENSRGTLEDIEKSIFLAGKTKIELEENKRTSSENPGTEAGRSNQE